MKNLCRIIQSAIVLSLPILVASQPTFNADKKENAVRFYTADTALQNLFDVAEQKIKKNIKVFSEAYTVMVEGAEYPYLWVETQPMGGVMYAKRDLKIAYNNMVVFLKYQLENGRIPGMIINTNNNIWNLSVTPVDNGKLGLFNESLQGFFIPGPALELYYLLNRDEEYLNLLYKSFAAYDAYLWKYRDYDKDGCLENWCVTDAGEDNLARYNYAPFGWPFEFPPIKGKISTDTNFLKLYWQKPLYRDFTFEKNPMPVESIDLMGYSFTCRDVLAKISAIKNDGNEKYWRRKADEVKDKMKSYLWLTDKQAYYYRDKNNKIIPTLTHNNLRAMFFGTMTQSMADNFIRLHLLNPKEFWTPMPLPSIAANDPYFKNASQNNWSGQPQGLTYQRAIRALENYGHYAEVSLIGKKLIDKVATTHLFTQQFDPFTTSQNGSDSYGPTLLSTLEYISRMYGVYLENEEVNFNGLALPSKYEYMQKMADNVYTIIQNQGKITGKFNGRELFRSTAGVKIVTDQKGEIIRLTGIDSVSVTVLVEVNNKKFEGTVAPNCIYKLQGGKIVLIKKIPFDYPYRKP